MSDPKIIELLKEMQSCGHETSYHYDVLDGHSGDYKAADEDFIMYSKVFADNGFRYVISTHPHRWMSSVWKINLKICVFRVVRETVIVVRHIPGEVA